LIDSLNSSHIKSRDAYQTCCFKSKHENEAFLFRSISLERLLSLLHLGLHCVFFLELKLGLFLDGLAEDAVAIAFELAPVLLCLLNLASFSC